MRRLVAREEGRDGTDGFGRRGRGEPAALPGKPLGHPRIRGRRDRVAAHAVARHGERRRAREAHDAFLGRRVVGLPGAALETCGGREGDDAARFLLAHVASGGLHHGEMPLQMHRDDRVPLLFRHVEDHPLAQDARAADEDVQVAELLERQVHHGPATRHGRHALRARHRLAALGADLAHHLVRGLARRIPPVDAHAVVIDDHLRAGRREIERYRAADARAPSGDDSDLAVEQSHRVGSPLLRERFGPAAT